MKTTKRIMVALVACLLCMTTFLPWAGADIIVSPQASELISTTSPGVDALGDGRIDASGYIRCTRSVDVLGFAYIRLQELQDGTWTTVKSAVAKYTSNASTHSYTFSYTGTPGMQYRTQVGFVAQYSGSSDTRTGTSATRTCK